MSTLLGLLAALAAAAVVVAQDSTVTSVDFSTDVLFSPESAWDSESNEACGTLDYYTTSVNANATVRFTGDQIVVTGMQNNASGVLQVWMDDIEPFTVNLYSVNVVCGTFFVYNVGEGNHTMTLSLLPAIGLPDEDVTIPLDPVLHLTSMSYTTIDNTETSTPVASEDGSSSSSNRNIGAIVGGVVGGVAGLILLGGALFFIRRRLRKRNSRHLFNPSNAVYITELSPRTVATPDPDAKLPDYARMEDDGQERGRDTKTAHLDVPPPSYSISATGLRSRSRSPAPDRKSMA